MYKKKVYVVLLLVFILLISTAFVNYALDPLQHYRKASFYKVYQFEDRYLLWGLLKNYKYDSIIVGTSMVENFIKSDVDDVLETDVLKASLSGASAYEENLVIAKALKNKNLKTIFYGLDSFSFRGNSKRLRFGRDSLPYYLINDNYFDDYKYLLNSDVFFRDNIKILLANYFGIKKNKINFDRFYEWNSGTVFSAEKAIKDFKSKMLKDNIEFSLRDNRASILIKSFNYNILKHIKNNPRIKFKIFFPPYSMLTYIYFQKIGIFKDMMKFKKYILDVLCKQENVEVFDFQVAKKITHNLNNYKDITHYSGKINYWMLLQLKAGHYKVKEQNYRQYIRNLIFQVDSYKVGYNGLKSQDNFF